MITIKSNLDETTLEDSNSTIKLHKFWCDPKSRNYTDQYVEDMLDEIKSAPQSRQKARAKEAIETLKSANAISKCLLKNAHQSLTHVQAEVMNLND